MKITITGTPGSGKSTLGRDLAETLDLKFLSIGDMRREMAKDRDMTLAELNKLGEEEAWTDEKVDDYQEKYGRENDDFVLEGRLSWHFIPDSIKIFLDADERVRAERQTERKLEEETYETVEEAIQANKERIESDRKRYDDLYGVDPYDLGHYDIVLDSTGKEPRETLREALEEIKQQRN